MFAWTLRGRVHHHDPAHRHLDRWTETFGDTPGYLASGGGVTRDRRFFMVVLWTSERAGDALLRRPEPHDWYAELERLFEHGIDFVETADVTAQLTREIAGAASVVVRRCVGVDRHGETCGGRAGIPSSAEELGRIDVRTGIDTLVSVTFHPPRPTPGTTPCEPASLHTPPDHAVEHDVIDHPFVHVATGLADAGLPVGHGGSGDRRRPEPR